MDQQEKQGGKCCGGCCDYRRAVIVLCIVALVFSAIGIIGPSLIVASPNIQSYYATYAGLEDIIKDLAAEVLIVEVINIVMTIIALVGAIRFNMWMVAIYVLWSIIYLIIAIFLRFKGSADIVDFLETQYGSNAAKEIEDVESYYNIQSIISSVFTAFFVLLWIYPSVFLTVEIKKGIMTKETYPREEMSCCCVSK